MLNIFHLVNGEDMPFFDEVHAPPHGPLPWLPMLVMLIRRVLLCRCLQPQDATKGFLVFRKDTKTMLWYKAWRGKPHSISSQCRPHRGMCLMYALLASRLYPGIAHETPRVRNYIQYIQGRSSAEPPAASCNSVASCSAGGLQRDRSQGTLATPSPSRQPHDAGRAASRDWASRRSSRSRSSHRFC